MTEEGACGIVSEEKKLPEAGGSEKRVPKGPETGKHSWRLCESSHALSERKRRRRNSDFLWFLLVFAVLFCSFYHKTLASGFDLLPGDVGDARFNILIAEHWIQFFKGELNFREVRMFYPLDFTLGFSDLSLLYAVMELPFRGVGLDAMRSVQISFYLLHFLGALSCFYLFRKLLHFHLLSSLTGMMVICFGNALAQKLGHTQFYTYFLLPPMLYCLICYCRCSENVSWMRRMGWLTAAELLGLLILYTGYYTAFFAAFYVSLFFSGLLLVFLFRENAQDFFLFLRWVRIRVVDFCIAGLIGMVGLIPFWMIYAPVLEKGFKRTWKDISPFLLNWYDLFNPGNGNFLWGRRFLENFPEAGERVYYHEFWSGFPWITLFLLGMSCVWGMCRLKKNMPQRNVYLAAMIFGFVSCVILALRGEGIMAAWDTVRRIFPGASGIRVVSRILLILLFPAGIILTFFLNGVAEKLSGWKFGGIVLAGIGMLLFLDHLNVNGNEHFSIAERRTFRESIVPPPEECRIFFVTKKGEIPGEGIELEQSFAQLDAMEIALYCKLKTVCGYSGNAPQNWSLNLIFKESYPQLLQAWVERHSIKEPLYCYDLNDKKWSGPVDLHVSQRKDCHLQAK